MYLNNVELLSLQTGYMQQDSFTKAMCYALTPRFLEVAGEVKTCLIIPNVDYLQEAVLDELAWELHVDWYDAAAPIEVKRNLIKNSDKVHMTLGTPYSVEQVVYDYFGDGNMEEWFEYGGEPYHFRIVTSNPSVTSDMANQFVKAINAVKRGSTILDEVIVDMSAELQLYFANVFHTGDVITIEQVV
jgi:phage tail P2-like protein